MSKISLLNAVKQKFLSQEATAIATLELYINDPVGVAEHSGVVDEIEKQVRILAEAKECLTLLESVMKPPAE
tara:strand:+ start:316 stop:531 length:216 start_codon:yes stop_codon:yes gene_type:complete